MLQVVSSLLSTCDKSQVFTRRILHGGHDVTAFPINNQLKNTFCTLLQCSVKLIVHMKWYNVSPHKNWGAFGNKLIALL